jgi:hypothetical protein
MPYPQLADHIGVASPVGQSPDPGFSRGRRYRATRLDRPPHPRILISGGPCGQRENYAHPDTIVKSDDLVVRHTAPRPSVANDLRAATAHSERASF